MAVLIDDADEKEGLCVEEKMTHDAKNDGNNETDDEASGSRDQLISEQEAKPKKKTNAIAPIDKTSVHKICSGQVQLVLTFTFNGVSCSMRLDYCEARADSLLPDDANECLIVSIMRLTNVATSNKAG